MSERRPAHEGSEDTQHERDSAPSGASQDGRVPDPGRRRLLAWLWRLPVIAAIAGAGYALYEASHILLGKQPAATDPDFEPIEPVAVAELSDFAEAWAEVRFEVAGRPAVAIRLPEAVVGALSIDSVHLAGYTRVCTHQACIVSLNRDTEAIAFGFNYRTDTPALVCPCHLSVFSPLRGGEAVSGPATEPLPRVRLALEGDQVMAVGLEGTPTGQP